MCRGDLAIALSVLAGALPLWVAAGRFPGTAGLFPRFAILLLAGAAVMLLARAVRIAPPSRRAKVAVEVSRGGDAPGVARAVGSFGVACAALAAARVVGLFPAAVLLTIGLAAVLGIQARRQYAVVAAVLFVLVYVVFVLALGVPLVSWRRGL